MLITLGRSTAPQAPYEIRDAAEKWARKAGRSATMHIAPLVGWFARLSLKPNDPAMRAYQEGRADQPATEDVFFHMVNPFEAKMMSITEVLADPRFKNVPLIDWWNGVKIVQKPYLQLDIIQLGASGVTNFLEREDTWSGRGVYKPLDKQVEDQLDANDRNAEKLRTKQEDDAGRRAHDRRRQLGKVAFVGVKHGKNKRTGV